MEKPPVRHLFDPKTGKDYFSIADVVGYVTDTVDARNYWKVLKNRLKKSSPELVTLCNRLKMKARDGKSYLTDAADAETLTEIIKLIPGARVNDLASCFEPFVTPPYPTNLPKGETKREANSSLPLGEPEGVAAELLLDAYQTDDVIFIEAFVAGVSLEDLNIEVNLKKITISGKKFAPRSLGEVGDYFTQELQWLSFSRELELPFPIDADRARASESQGHLTIRLPKI